ncbi:hypothetical protein GUJ93_ZPchr0006g41029 [Zizania palustris]|uniref:Uncharacterized protein n=1 Tax=Zizania palustris TaxID=103762 RepID=A0A8J5SBR1_ZIZPA|nr:hypothetical protein GUJ93_ZPchr0006g41029 [Zizania palustris]
MEKQPQVDFPCAVNLATTDEDYNRSPIFVTRSLSPTNCDEVDCDLAPQPLPSHADDEGANPEKDGGYVGGGDEDWEGEDDDEDARIEGLKLVAAYLGPDFTTSSSQSGTRSSSGLAASRFPTTRMPSSFEDDMRANAKASNLEKNWISEGRKPVFGSQAVLVQKLNVHIEYRAV